MISTITTVYSFGNYASFVVQEFRRESGYRFQLQCNSPWVYSCSECSSSKEDCNDNVHLWKEKARRAFVSVSPPPRDHK